MPAYLFEGGREVAPRPRAPLRPEQEPKISCLMVTRDRPELARLAVRCFADQIYPNRELVVIDDGHQTDLRPVLEEAGLEPAKLRYVKAPPGLSLGELRNLSVAEASGDYVCTWDDDDLHDPLRLALQYGVLHQSGAQASFLLRLVIWWPRQGWLAASSRSLWENTMLCEKAVLPAYPPLPRGEDTPVVREIRASRRVAAIDEPRLYGYVVHGANTWGVSHFAVNWINATARFTDEGYQAMLADLGERLPIAAYRQALGARIGAVSIRVAEVRKP